MQETIDEVNNERQLNPEALENKVRNIFKTLGIVDAWQAQQKLVDAGKDPEFAKCDGKYICQTYDGCFEGETMEEAVALALTAAKFEG